MNCLVKCLGIAIFGMTIALSNATLAQKPQMQKPTPRLSYQQQQGKLKQYSHHYQKVLFDLEKYNFSAVRLPKPKKVSLWESFKSFFSNSFGDHHPSLNRVPANSSQRKCLTAGYYDCEQRSSTVVQLAYSSEINLELVVGEAARPEGQPYDWLVLADNYLPESPREYKDVELSCRDDQLICRPEVYGYISNIGWEVESTYAGVITGSYPHHLTPKSSVRDAVTRLAAKLRTSTQYGRPTTPNLDKMNEYQGYQIGPGSSPEDFEPFVNQAQKILANELATENEKLVADIDKNVAPLCIQKPSGDNDESFYTNRECFYAAREAGEKLRHYTDQDKERREVAYDPSEKEVSERRWNEYGGNPYTKDTPVVSEFKNFCSRTRIEADSSLSNIQRSDLLASCEWASYSFADTLNIEVEGRPEYVDINSINWPGARQNRNPPIPEADRAVK